MATPIGRIELAAQTRILLHADPGSISAAVILGKHVQPKLTGRDLAKAQLAAWDNFIGVLGQPRKKTKGGRR